jgi:hypothetical protein
LPLAYLDYDDLCELAARVLAVDVDAVRLMTSGEAFERILMGPTRIERATAPSSDAVLAREADLIHRAAELARRILSEQPLPRSNEELAWSALVEFVRRNGHHVVDMPPSTRARLLGNIDRAVPGREELAERLSEYVTPSPEPRKA